MFLPHPRVKVIIVGSLRDREVACSASDRQGSNFESCVWRTVSSQSSHHPQEVLLAQFSLYVHKSGLKPDSFHFFYFKSDLSSSPRFPHGTDTWRCPTCSSDVITNLPANTRCSPEVGSMLCQRRRRWTGIEMTLNERPLFFLAMMEA